MKHSITQQDAMGCGVACAAFATGKTYEETVAMLGVRQAQTIGFRLKELTLFLNEYVATYQGRHINAVSRGRIYDNGVIVFIRRSKRYPYGHYLIRHDGMWMDPWLNLRPGADVSDAQSGYRRRLPGQAQWAIVPMELRSNL